MVHKLMTDNVIIVENPNAIKSKTRKKIQFEPKVEEMLIKQLDESKIKKNFERMTSLLGINNRQYLAMVNFEQFYKNRKNHGIE